MSKLLNSGNIGSPIFKNLSEQRKRIVDTWEQSGLLDGLKGMDKPNIAQLFEGQASQLLSETPATNSELIEHYTKSSSTELKIGNNHGARYNLYMLIRVMNLEILNKHCR